MELAAFVPNKFCVAISFPALDSAQCCTKRIAPRRVRQKVQNATPGAGGDYAGAKSTLLRLTNWERECIDTIGEPLAADRRGWLRL